MIGKGGGGDESQVRKIREIPVVIEAFTSVYVRMWVRGSAQVSISKIRFVRSEYRKRISLGKMYAEERLKSDLRQEALEGKW
jgi:hypothetical protein